MEYSTLRDFESWMTISEPSSVESSFDSASWYGWLREYRRETELTEEQRDEAYEHAEELYQAWLEGEPLDQDDILVLQRSGAL